MISIIIPTLNEESVIENTLKNLAEKMTLPHEIIVSDGKSSDTTAEIARKYCNKVLVYSGEKRQTIAEGRNSGAAAASGEFLVFMDADCIIENPDDFFTHALEHFKYSKTVGLAVAIKVLPDLETIFDKVIFTISNYYQMMVNNFFHGGAAPGEFQMMRKSAFAKLGGYNESLAVSEDIEMFGRLSKIGRIFFDINLTVYHTGRRAHAIGWPRLLCLWLMNFTWVTLFKKSYSKVWTEIR